MSLGGKPVPTPSGTPPIVQAFYERHPYPPPVGDLEGYRQRWLDPQRRRADFHLFQPTQAFREGLSILVAGCGTSQAAKHALRWPSARVTGIDFSATSVRCTQELKRKYQLDNLEVHQLPIERVGELAASFDQVVCTGVLHHLPDPDAGLRALRPMLKPDGVLHLMLYASYGRTGVYMLQDFCRRVGITASDDGILDLAEALKALPRDHPLQPLLRQALDFSDSAAIADALLHPQDRAYSVPELFAFLERGGFSFDRWTSQAPYSPRCGVMATIPQAGRLAALAPPDQYAAVELFRGTMATHSVVASRDDRTGAARQPAFAGDAWLRYVPIRLPDTLCVQERLPPGAAAVLINRSHPFRDLVLPISPVHKQLFDAIDDHRCIGEILRQVQASAGFLPADEVVREFFEALGEWDQVVFDASRARP